MRIDKFLWCIRACKTRSVAATYCKNGKVWINGELIKASRETKSGDEISIRKGPIVFSIRVLSFPVSRVGAKEVPKYIEDITAAPELKKLEMLRLQRSAQRPSGLGRPTKRERRELDDFLLQDDEEDLLNS
ncbi:MAG: RNA-binding S4 domain-containing protein [Flavobacteriales bacterium]|nr:RNA-binding S4 domain-containing protein [Flavobacteriales bacterium]